MSISLRPARPSLARAVVAATVVVLAAAALAATALPGTSTPRAAAAVTDGPNCATGFDDGNCLGLGRRGTISGPGSERKMSDYWLLTVAHSRDTDPDDAAFIESLDGRWINGMCIQDNSSHPGGVITEIMTLAERYPSSPNVAFERRLAVARYFLDPFAATGTNDQVVALGGESLTLADWYSGMWTYGHWVAQDRRAGVGGPTIVDFTTQPASSGARNGAAAIHRVGERYELPWTSTSTLVDHGDGTGTLTTTVTSATGHPVPGVASRWDADAAAAAAPTSPERVLTDAAGRARWTVAFDDGARRVAAGSRSQVPVGTVTVFVGSGQDIAGWTPDDVTAIASDASLDLTRVGHLYLTKSSSDPAVSVAGTVIAFFDGSGDRIGELTVGADGRTDVLAIDDAVHEPPYSWQEVAAAPGLEPRIGRTEITATLSDDPDAPTELAIENVAIANRFRVVKALDDPDVQGKRDMSGFAFQVTEVATGDDLGTFVTDAAGRTPSIDAVYGDHRITEVDRPPWASRLGDPGPLTFAFDPAAGEAEFTYTNTVPSAHVESDALDPSDGDQHLPWFGGPAIVTITYEVPIVGGTYVARVVGIDRATGEPIDGLAGSTSFVAAAGTGSIDVPIDVPADLSTNEAPVDVVFFDQLVDERGVTIARHEELDDTRQLLTVARRPAAEVHLRKTVSNDGATWINAQDGVIARHDPGPAPADPSAGSHDDGPSDDGDGIPIYTAGDSVSFRYELWLDAASTGVVRWPTTDLDALVVDDAGTPDDRDDDMVARYVSGDDGDGFLEPDEIWIFDAPETRTAVAGERHVNDATVAPGEVFAAPDLDQPPIPEQTTPRNDPAGYTVPAVATSFEVVGPDGSHRPDGGDVTGDDRVVDRVAATNLEPSTDYVVELVVMERHDGTCSPTDTTAVASVTSDDHGHLVVDVGPVDLTGHQGTTLVAFERVVHADSGVMVAAHEDCDAAEQTIRVEPEAAGEPTPPPRDRPTPTPPRPLPTTGLAGGTTITLVAGVAVFAVGLTALAVARRRCDPHRRPVVGHERLDPTDPLILHRAAAGAADTSLTRGFAEGKSPHSEVSRARSE